MRALHAVPVLLASLVVAGSTTAHGTVASRRVAKVSSTHRIHRTAWSAPAPSAAGPTRSRNGTAELCAQLEEQAQSVVMRSHRIVRGDSLSGIAALYGTSVRALAAANGLRPDAVIRTGQELVIPQHDRPGGGNEWLKYARSPAEPGVVTLVTYKEHFRGLLLERGRLSPSARSAVSTLLGVKGSRPPVPDRLLRLLVRVSDTFGGRPIRVVSGFRSSSYFSDSRHKQSAAIDFSIPGIPNNVLRQYLLLFDDVGVGYYPNSSFLHLDVRDCAMQWVDYAGPGEAPRLRPRRFRQAPSPADLDEVAESVVAALDRSRPAPDEPAEAAAASDTAGRSDPP